MEGEEGGRGGREGGREGGRGGREGEEGGRGGREGKEGGREREERGVLLHVHVLYSYRIFLSLLLRKRPSMLMARTRSPLSDMMSMIVKTVS